MVLLKVRPCYSRTQRDAPVLMCTTHLMTLYISQRESQLLQDGVVRGGPPGPAYKMICSCGLVATSLMGPTSLITVCSH